MADVNDIMESVRKRAQATNRRLCEEIRKLMESPDAFTLASLLMDNFLAGLAYLYNFKSLTDGYGRTVETFEVIEHLEREARAEFLKLTGKNYVPVSRRTDEFVFKGTIE